MYNIYNSKNYVIKNKINLVFKHKPVKKIALNNNLRGRATQICCLSHKKFTT